MEGFDAVTTLIFMILRAISILLRRNFPAHANQTTTATIDARQARTTTSPLRFRHSPNLSIASIIYMLRPNLSCLVGPVTYRSPAGNVHRLRRVKRTLTDNFFVQHLRMSTGSDRNVLSPNISPVLGVNLLQKEPQQSRFNRAAFSSNSPISSRSRRPFSEAA